MFQVCLQQYSNVRRQSKASLYVTKSVNELACSELPLAELDQQVRNPPVSAVTICISCSGEKYSLKMI